MTDSTWIVHTTSTVLKDSMIKIMFCRTYLNVRKSELNLFIYSHLYIYLACVYFLFSFLSPFSFFFPLLSMFLPFVVVFRNLSLGPRSKKKSFFKDILNILLNVYLLFQIYSIDIFFIAEKVLIVVESSGG